MKRKINISKLVLFFIVLGGFLIFALSLPYQLFFVNTFLKYDNKFSQFMIKYGSFVLTRPTTPLSILVEVGFMINPFEYEKLLMPKYQKIYASGIANGIKEYFK